MQLAETTARNRIKAAGNMPPNGIKVGSDLHLCEMLLGIIDIQRKALQKIADLVDSEAGEPLDDAIETAGLALTETN